MVEHIETIIVGAGQAGLAMSRCFSEAGREHLVLERSMVADRWRSQRWDSLRFQFPNWSLELPGKKYDGPEPEAFSHKDEVRRFIEDYAQQIHAPVRTGVEVSALDEDGNAYVLATSAGTYQAKQVVIATGPYQRPRIAPIASGLPRGIVQWHASEYRNAAQLPAGAVLVVGSGASGCQIAEELLTAGRDVFFAIGRHRRAPRRYRGHDAFWWRRELGQLDLTVDDVPPADRLPPPLVTGVGGGHTVSLRRYADDGMRLLGHLRGIRDGKLFIADDLERNLAAGDRTYDEFTAAIDRHIEERGLATPDESASDARSPLPPHPEMLDLQAENIGSVIWATGYDLDFRWVHLPVFDERGRPVQRRGATAAAGVYFLGLAWLHKVKSSFLYGVGEDARQIAARMDGRGGAV